MNGVGRKSPTFKQLVMVGLAHFDNSTKYQGDFSAFCHYYIINIQAKLPIGDLSALYCTLKIS